MIVPLPPVAKERVRKDPERGHLYTPRQTRKFEEDVGLCWQAVWREPWPKGVPLYLRLLFVMPRPEHLAHAHHVSAPDGSNLQKAVEDGLNKVAYHDDSQIVEWQGAKRYARPGEMPFVEIVLETVPEDMVF